MATNGNGEGFDIRWGDKSFSARGLVLIIIIPTLLLGGVVFYSNWRVEQAIDRVEAEGHRLFGTLMATLKNARAERELEHERLRRSLNLNACITLFDFQERKQLRGRTYKEFSQECPFMDEKP